MPDFFAVTQETGEVLVNASPTARREVLYASGKGPLHFSYEPHQDVDQEIALGEHQTFDRPVYLRGGGRGDCANVIVEPGPRE